MNREDVIREIQDRYRQSGRSLNELQRRLWAATEAMKIGRGGLTIVSKALRISPNTIKRGMRELATGQTDLSEHANARIRQPGGGRKPKKLASGGLTRTPSSKSPQGIEPGHDVSDRIDERRPDASPVSTVEESAAFNQIAIDKNATGSESH